VRHIAFPPILLTAALVCVLPAAPAQAQAARTFVSAAGSDTNSCTNVATPCRHFAAAYAATAPNGEIYVLDPANYGPLTITGPVSIEGHGWASVAPSGIGSAAITINAHPGENINIIGVVLDGTALTNTTGIRFNSGGSLTVRDSVIRNFGSPGFGGVGLDFLPNGSTSSQLFVSNTLVADNGSSGIEMDSAGSGTTIGVLDHVDLENNDGGLVVNGADTQTINVTITDSVSSNNRGGGIVAVSNNTAPLNIMARNCTIANNGSYGLFTASGATIRVTRSTITGNFAGWFESSGVVSSYGDNNIDGNGSVNTQPPNPLTYK
jgi:hypothetical protein